VEELLSCCSSVLEGSDVVALTEERKNNMAIQCRKKHAQSGLRMLAFAFRSADAEEEDFLHHLTLVGVVGFLDPPRPEVRAAIQECRSAGIKVVMITGDHPATAKNIAMQLGLAEESDEVVHGNSMKPYDQLTPEDKQSGCNPCICACISGTQAGPGDPVPGK